MAKSEYLRRLKQDGWCVVEQVIPESEAGRLREEVAASTRAHQNPATAEQKGIGHVGGFIQYDQSLAPYLPDQRVLDPIEGLLGPHVKVSFTTATINLSGNARGGWHADWPFNQNNAGHLPAPYPDTPMHVTTLWMLSAFTEENGGTLVVPGSHRVPNNPTGDIDVDPLEPYPTEINATGSAGSVLVMDSRLWHATAPNITDEPRVSVVVRYAPWWLNTRILMPGSPERQMMVDEPGLTDNEQPPIPPDVYARLPDEAKPLFRHWVGDA